MVRPGSKDQPCILYQGRLLFEGKSKPLTQKMVKDAANLLKLRDHLGKKLVKWLKEHMAMRSTPDETDLIRRVAKLVSMRKTSAIHSLDVNPALLILQKRVEILEDLERDLKVEFLTDPVGHRGPSSRYVFPTKFVNSWIINELQPLIKSANKAVERAYAVGDGSSSKADDEDEFETPPED